MKDIKVGDVVHVRGKVTRFSRSDERLSVEFEDHRQHIGPDGAIVSASVVVHVEPRPIKVGDRVRYAGFPCMTVLAIHNGFAWLEHGHQHCTLVLENLTRIEGEPS